MQRHVIILILMLSLLLVSCGRQETDPAAVTGALASQAYPIATPTPSILDATKQADDEQLAQEIQTAAALPTSATLPPLPTDLPPEPLLSGLSTDCETAYFRNIIVSSNCWQNSVDGSFIFFVAGHDVANPNQGKVGTYTILAGEIEPPSTFDFPTPSLHGSVTIINVALPRFTLRGEDNTLFVFNIETQLWED